MTSRTRPSDRSDATPDRPRADEAARRFAVDPRRHVALEASAGTGKTRILVDRFLNLLAEGVDPSHILAITFTRKAAAEMRERIVGRLRRGAAESKQGAALWRAMRDRLGEVNISTIDSFCLSLLKEFPLEADLEPGFEMADDTEALRLADESLDRALRAARRLALADADVRLALGSLGEAKFRAALEALLARRLVTLGALRRFVGAAPADLSLDRARSAMLDRLAASLAASGVAADRLVASGPVRDPAFGLLADDLRALADGREVADLAGALQRLRRHFLNAEGDPRRRPGRPKVDFASEADYREHAGVIARVGPRLVEALGAFDRDLNVLLARGLGRVLRLAALIHRRTLERHGVIDFTEGLARTLRLLGQMEEFARSRYRLESRYHHVLVDEFQDTSRAQWRLVARLIESWGEGSGLASASGLDPTIFVVGDRKQSIYGFRDADVRVMGQAGRIIERLRPGARARRSIRHSFRAVPALLAFTNDLFDEVEVASEVRGGFRYRPSDRFPVDQTALAAGVGEPGGAGALGIVAAPSPAASAEAVADEIARLLDTATIRDRDSGLRRDALPGDIAILFRSRAGHRDFERALEARGVPSYVYKGLGFFDADEVRDLLALVRWLADPRSEVRAAAFLRSRLVRLSDEGLRRLRPSAASALLGSAGEAGSAALDEEDRRVMDLARASSARWLGLVDRLPPADLIDAILDECAYAIETRGGRRQQAAENVKKFRGIARRSQNRGYLTMARLARHLDRVSVSDEGNAVIDAAGAVNLMTIHAAKGLEFPIVFVVNAGRGSGNHRAAVVVERREAGAPPLVAIGPATQGARDAVASREREETKRLCYVAVTRARDRLYFAAHLDDAGQFRARGGSLAQVLPASFRDLFGQAGAREAGSRVEWRAASGGCHRFEVCGRRGGEADASARRARVQPSVPSVDRFDPLPARVEMLRVAVTSLAGATGGVAGSAVASGGEAGAPVATGAEAGSAVASSPARVAPAPAAPSPPAAPPAGHPAAPPAAHPAAHSPEAALAGTIVHALFERLAREADLPGEAALLALARDRLAEDPMVVPEDAGDLAGRAVRLFLDLRGQLDACELTAVGRRLHEVPFSLSLPAAGGAASTIVTAPSVEARSLVVRGKIDCLVFRPDGAIAVVDFKTGAPREEDDRQLSLYVEAVRTMYPGRAVEGLVIRPGGERNHNGEASV